MTTTLDRAARTDAPTRRLPRATVPVLIGLLGLAIGLAGAGIPSIWYDEAATVSSSLRTWPQLLAEIGTVDLVHAAYYAGMHVWFDLVGYTPVTLRLPSAVAIGAAAALVVVLGRLFARPRLGLLAGLVFVLLPRVTWAGTEGRSYALTALLAVALTVVLVVAMRDGRRRWWVVYAALAALSCVVFLYLALVVVAHAVAVALAARSRAERMPARRWMLAATAAVLAVLPFLVATTTQRGQVDWLPRIGPRTIDRVLVEQWFFTSDAFAIVGWAGILLGAALLVRRARPGLSLAALILPAALLPTALLVLVSVAAPLYTPRYLTMCLPFVALLIGAAIDALPRRPLVIVALAALVALAVPQIVEQRQPRAKEHTDWSAVAALIAAERAEDGADATTAIVYDTVERHPRATSRVIAYAYPDAFADAIDPTLGVSAADSGRLWETTIPLADGLARLQDADTVYLLTSTGDDGTVATAATLAPLGWRITDRWTVSEVEIVRFAR